MAKVNPTFQYDAFRFLIRSLRIADKNGELERYMGAMQTEFERTHARIQQLPEINDIALVEDELLKYLKWIVGWTDEKELSFVNNLTNDQLRKLIKLSVPLWKSKGRQQGLIDAIRIFTGKSAGFRSWFDQRWIMDEAGLWFTGIVDDPWIVGGMYTGDDEVLSWLFMNRSELDDVAKRLVYDLTTYIVPANEHYGIVYCAFFDDFLDGTLDQWVLGGDPITVTDDLRALLPEDVNMEANVLDSELETWSPFQRVEATLYTQDNLSGTSISVAFMRDSNSSKQYRITLGANGSLFLQWNDGTSFSTLVSTSTTLPVGAVGGGEPFLVSCTSSPINDAENRIVVSINGQIEIDYTATLSECLRDSGAGIGFTTAAGSSGIYIDNVIVQASPTHVQFVGQRSLIDQGQIADPDPGNEVFSPTPSNPVFNPYVIYLACIQADWASWTLAGFWQVSNFSALCDSYGLWFGQNGVGTFPNHTVDMEYVGAADAIARSPSLDLSDIDSSVYSVHARVWYRPNKLSPTPGSDEVVSLRYNIGAGDVTIASFLDGSSVEFSRVEADADPRIADGQWWREQVFEVPPAAFTASVNFNVLFDVNGAYTNTDFGMGITRFALEVTRK